MNRFFLSFALVFASSWAEASTASMPGNTMAGLKLLAGNGIVTGTSHSNLNTISGLDPSSPADLALAGLLQQNLPAGFDDRLAQAVAVQDTAAEKALYIEAVAAYDAAAAKKAEEIRRKVNALEEKRGGMSADELWREAGALSREAFYGAEVAAEVIKVRAWAREATRNETMGKAERIAGALDTSHPAGAEPGPSAGASAVGEGKGALALGPGIGQGKSLPARTVLDQKLEAALQSNNLTMTDFGGPQGAVEAAEVTAFMAGIRASELSVNLSQAVLGRRLKQDEPLPVVLGPAINSAENMALKFDGHIPDQARYKGRLVIIRNQAGKIVGTAAFAPYKTGGVVHEGVAEMETIAADPSVRNSGLGLLLVEWSMQEASRNGYDTMYLDTRSRSMTMVTEGADRKVRGAYPMYVRFGFMPSDQTAAVRFAGNTTAKHPEEVAYMMRGIRPEELASIPDFAPAESRP